MKSPFKLTNAHAELNIDCAYEFKSIEIFMEQKNNSVYVVCNNK